MLSAFVSLLGGLASEPGHEGTADREHLVARLCGPWATYSRIGGGPAPRAIAEGRQPHVRAQMADKVAISGRGGAGRRSPTRHSVPPRANSDTASARRFERLASRDARGEPRPDHPALWRTAAPQAAGGRLVAGTGGCRRVTARPDSPPRARRDDGGGRAG